VGKVKVKFSTNSILKKINLIKIIFKKINWPRLLENCYIYIYVCVCVCGLWDPSLKYILLCFTLKRRRENTVPRLLFSLTIFIQGTATPAWATVKLSICMIGRRIIYRCQLSTTHFFFHLFSQGSFFSSNKPRKGV